MKNISIIVKDKYGRESELIYDGENWLWTRHGSMYLFDKPIPFNDREKAIDTLIQTEYGRRHERTRK